MELSDVPNIPAALPEGKTSPVGIELKFDVFSTVHHSIELFHQPTLMHTSI